MKSHMYASGLPSGTNVYTLSVALRAGALWLLLLLAVAICARRAASCVRSRWSCIVISPIAVEPHCFKIAP